MTNLREAEAGTVLESRREWRAYPDAFRVVTSVAGGHHLASCEGEAPVGECTCQ
jgi:hypothetical protein